MSTSSPADLAVAFRSLPRRLAQACDHDTPRSAVAAATADVDAAVAAAASDLGSAPTPEAVAGAIEERPVARWTEDELDGLQRRAAAAARVIRELEDLARSD